MINYFQLLDLKQQYDIDQTLLQKQYLSMQAKYHPDRARTTEDKNKAMDVAMQLNEA
ncbi:MAG: co-chaperone HscB, partial [Rickettsiaceae bacterium]|nr:co-chaperone HscB [Rickettsiaceae bacterium]